MPKLYILIAIYFSSQLYANNLVEQKINGPSPYEMKLKQECDVGKFKSCMELGQHLMPQEDGHIIYKGTSEAKKPLEKACLGKIDASCKLLGEISEYEENLDAALVWYSKIKLMERMTLIERCKKGDGESCIQLAHFLAVHKNILAANNLYLQACKKNKNLPCSVEAEKSAFKKIIPESPELSLIEMRSVCQRFNHPYYDFVGRYPIQKVEYYYFSKIKKGVVYCLYTGGFDDLLDVTGNGIFPSLRDNDDVIPSKINYSIKEDKVIVDRIDYFACESLSDFTTFCPKDINLTEIANGLLQKSVKYHQTIHVGEKNDYYYLYFLGTDKNKYLMLVKKGNKNKDVIAFGKIDIQLDLENVLEIKSNQIAFVSSRSIFNDEQSVEDLSTLNYVGDKWVFSRIMYASGGRFSFDKKIHLQFHPSDGGYESSYTFEAPIKYSKSCSEAQLKKNSSLLDTKGISILLDVSNWSLPIITKCDLMDFSQN
ncbi:MAG: hypothetical protein KBD76_10750 [Bacteriovorax sp.]|nr:hypothetical protein [Bacteriovorax sp.]